MRPSASRAGARLAPVRLERSTALTAVAVLTMATLFGALLAVTSLALVIPIGLALGLLAWHHPGLAVATSLGAAAIHSGLFLLLRINLVGVPLSVFDIVPGIFLVSAASIAVRERGRTWLSPLQATCLVSVLAGIFIGALLGVRAHAASHQLLQVLRLELDLAAVLAATCLAGGSETWRRGVVRGLLLAAQIVAAELLVAFFFTVLTGVYFWGLFPFGRAIDNVSTQLARGNILILRENPVSAFLLLPGLCLTLSRLKDRDAIFAAAFVAAGLVWLSRSFWVAMAATVVLVLAFRLRSSGFSLADLIRRVAVLLPVAAIVIVVAGGILQRRLDATTTLSSSDASVNYRLLETNAALHALESSPFHFAFGLGTGVVVPHALRGRIPSAQLENGVLSEWTNGGLAFMLGSALLFFSATVRGWRIARRAPRNSSQWALGVSVLCLVPLWLEGLAGGTLTIVEATVALWLLAGTALATPSPKAAPVEVPALVRRDPEGVVV